ncbi:MAG: NAD(P)/FAD-dependent oxidoreductase [Dehalococcoidia bacterium]|nr:NAD(P)/FAD-dependent oxidoreductase [Dehalococcoidia bacterium]
MNVGIIGGGIAGLTAAYRLQQLGHQVAVYEARPFLGGQAGTFEVGGERLEVFYHHLFSSDTHVISLIEEMGLGERLSWRDSKVGFYYGGRVYDFVTPMDLLRFRPVSLVDRVRLGLVGLYLRRQKDWRRYEGVTAREWIRRWAGKRNYEVVWGPLLKGKFGSRADDVGMVWFWGKIFLRFASRGGGVAQKEKLGYLMGSFGLLTDELSRRLREGGARLETGRPVEQIVVQDGRASGVRLAGGETAPHDAVIATVPNGSFLQMAPFLPQSYAALLRKVQYQWATCLVLALKESLSRIYWMNISDPEIPFVGAIEHTNYIEPSHYGGRRILYLSNYVEESSPVADMSIDEISAHYLPHLTKINPAFSPDWVTERWLFKDPAGQPVITTNYGSSIPDHRTPVPGLYLANTTQIYPEDRGLNYSVRLGENIARLVSDDQRAT